MAEPKIVTTTIVVNFQITGADADYILNVEVDDRPEGLNKGNTTFSPGDTVYLLLFKTSNVTIKKMIASKGSVTSVGSATKSIDDFVAFANEPQQSLSYPINNGLTLTWYGSNLGNTTVINESVLKLSSPPATDYIGVARVEYDSNATALRLSNTFISSTVDYPIHIFIFGEVS